MLVVGHLVTIRRLDVIAIAIARDLQDFAEHEVGPYLSENAIFGRQVRAAK
jgi:hypothetical protein